MPRQKPKFEKKERRLTGLEKIQRAVHRVSVEEDNGMTDARCTSRIKNIINPVVNMTEFFSGLDIEQWTVERVKKRPQDFIGYVTNMVEKAKEFKTKWNGERQFKDKKYYVNWKKRLAESLQRRSVTEQRDYILSRVEHWQRVVTNATDLNLREDAVSQVAYFLEELDQFDAKYNNREEGGQVELTMGEPDGRSQFTVDDQVYPTLTDSAEPRNINGMTSAQVREYVDRLRRANTPPANPVRVYMNDAMRQVYEQERERMRTEPHNPLVDQVARVMTASEVRSRQQGRPRRGEEALTLDEVSIVNILVLEAQNGNYPRQEDPRFTERIRHAFNVRLMTEENGR